MLHPDDQSDVVSGEPRLDPREAALVSGLAGVGGGPRQVWPGQPGRRSPWLPCADGCCLVLEARSGADPAEWLRFLVRELLAPVARVQVARAERFGLPGGHRLGGRVLLDGVVRPRLLVAVGRRVRVIALDDDLFPVETPTRRSEGEVVPLESPRGQSTER